MVCDRRIPDIKWKYIHTNASRHKENLAKYNDAGDGKETYDGEFIIEVLVPTLSSNSQQKKLHKCDKCNCVFMSKYSRDRHCVNNCCDK